MSELINKNEVMNVANGFTFTDKTQRRQYIDFLEYCLNNAPTVEAKPVEWIPCSERLPKYIDEYNVTVGVANEFGYYERVTTLRFENIQGKEPKWIIPVDKVYTVIAWMELPAPYKEDMRGVKND